MHLEERLMPNDFSLEEIAALKALGVPDPEKDLTPMEPPAEVSKLRPGTLRMFKLATDVATNSSPTFKIMDMTYPGSPLIRHHYSKQCPDTKGDMPIKGNTSIGTSYPREEFKVRKEFQKQPEDANKTEKRKSQEAILNEEGYISSFISQGRPYYGGSVMTSLKTGQVFVDSFPDPDSPEMKTENIEKLKGINRTVKDLLSGI
jgi:hypothetical protein